MSAEPGRRWGAGRGILGGMLDIGVEMLAVGLFVLVALGVAALVLWVA